MAKQIKEQRKSGRGLTVTRGSLTVLVYLAYFTERLVFISHYFGLTNEFFLGLRFRKKVMIALFCYINGERRV